jgi:hypothetical protein
MRGTCLAGLGSAATLGSTVRGWTHEGHNTDVHRRSQTSIDSHTQP